MLRDWTTSPEQAHAEALRAALGWIGPWRPHAQAWAGRLAAPGHRPLLDVQRAFALCPPDSAAGVSLLRLTEALPRTSDRSGKVHLLREHVPFLRASALIPVMRPVALPVAGAVIDAMARQFVYAERIEGAVARARRDTGWRYSFDMLGEGARTAADAQRNLEKYADAIRACGAAGPAAGPAGEAARARFGVSVKISSIHPRYDAASYPLVREELLARLRELCRAAAGRGIGLTLDAEESERAALHLDLFERLALDEALLSWSGLGIAVQAYRCRAPETLQAVIDAARARAARGGAPLCVRLVKGAYWDAEVKRAQELGVEAYPVFTDKRTTDLSYFACAKKLLQSVPLVYPQFATHNAVTLGGVLAMAEGVAPAAFECQRLHGMGESEHAALREALPEVAVRTYAPVGSRGDLLPYLVRRLLENGASTSYVRQRARGKDVQASLRETFDFIAAASSPPRSFPLPADLQMPERRIARGYDLAEPETLATWAHDIASQRRKWSAAPIVNGQALRAGPARGVRSPARPDIELGEVIDGTPDTARAAVAAAHAARAAWAATPVSRRAALLERLADLMEADMRPLAALCVWEAGKTIADAVADVREAIDFCRYYAAEGRRLFAAPLPLRGSVGETNQLSLHGRGVFACISPWNFPAAIFTGQVAAALVAGNTVVAKPAEQTSLTACRIAELIHAAGVPGEVFHLVPGRGDTVGKAIVSDLRIAGVAFTGSNQTARAIQAALLARGGAMVPFIAETGGLNTMIVDSTALPEQVVDAVVASAFRSAGQRCSSLRVLYLQDEIADPVLDMLRGAMAELRVGDPADPATDIGPLIDADARAALAAYVEELRRRARLVGEVTRVPEQGSFLAPVAFEVQSMREVPGERFGPILHVVRFPIEALDGVIDDINGTGYGLTMGVHTRLEGRAEYIRSRAAVGNLYVNRNMIGAVVGVQPFGGEGLSGTGPKAGGPNYLARFATERVFTVNTAAAGGDVALVTAPVLR